MRVNVACDFLQGTVLLRSTIFCWRWEHIVKEQRENGCTAPLRSCSPSPRCSNGPAELRFVCVSDRHDFPRRLDSERERRDVDEQQIFGGVAAVALEDAGLNSRAVCDGPEKENTQRQRGSRRARVSVSCVRRSSRSLSSLAVGKFVLTHPAGRKAKQTQRVRAIRGEGVSPSPVSRRRLQHWLQRSQSCKSK